MGNLDFVGPIRDQRNGNHQVLGPERWEKGKIYVDEQDYKVPDDVTGLHFLHYRRPGQGTISDRPTLGLELVLISPRTPDEAQALRDWGDFVHIRDIAAAAPDHFTMITPYENASGGTPRFMHFYELDTDDPEPAFRRMAPSTMERVGAYGTHAQEEWWNHEALVIDYVNTFRRVGVKER